MLGSYGPGWEADWGTFETFTSEGKTALQACCNCGGGIVPTTCTDFANWTDTDGDTCQKYTESAWCNSTGGFGPGWGEEWGTFESRTVSGKGTPAQACCHCGGGSDPSVALASVAGAATPSTELTPPPSATLLERKTWSGCACKKQWSEHDLSCEHTCCNPDKDPLGDWCIVEDVACEEQGWGYCRPPGVIAKACVDEPKGWRDKEGEDCGIYGMDGFCTITGGYGIGWEEALGNFSAFAVDGRSAAEACCNCGGGKLPERCTDVAEWADVDGDTCQSYIEHAWCNQIGGYAIGWGAEWGTFESHSVKSKGSASAACCACGGGKSLDAITPSLVTTSGSATAADNDDDDDDEDDKRPNSPPPALPTSGDTIQVLRKTWNGCACKPTWVDEGDSVTCTTTCCNPDKDPVGEWCMVEDKDCEDQVRGYCRPPGVVSRACRDEPRGWRDSDAEDCGTYGSEGFCTVLGGYGVGWDASWGAFEAFKAAGTTATAACCNCGGGKLPSGCVDTAHWADDDGDTCQSYVESRWCNSTGGQGPGWGKDWDPYGRGSKGPASVACCGCGGGSDGATAAQQGGLTGDDDVQAVVNEDKDGDRSEDKPAPAPAPRQPGSFQQFAAEGPASRPSHGAEAPAPIGRTAPTPSPPAREAKEPDGGGGGSFVFIAVIALLCLGGGGGFFYLRWKNNQGSGCRNFDNGGRNQSYGKKYYDGL
mmetsp:Transcript_110405/g.356071  ORF Transcript_110405/g.356071 Transcript_110405/m.356071 type:complete len:706 (-) Transcript_110405:182-2299(-)